MVTVVTGASGFLGSVLVRTLLAEGRKVRCVDIHRGPGLADLDVEWIAAGVLNRSSLGAALDSANVVHHLAAVISVTGDPTGRVWETNVDGVRNVAEAAMSAGVDRFVHCSSVHAYDLEAVERVTEDSPRSVSAELPVYDRSKAAGEAELRGAVAGGLEAVIVNPTGVIGPQDFARSRVNAVIMAMFDGTLPALIDGGFDWVDVRDVASSMIAAETKGRVGENYLLPGNHVSLKELSVIAEHVSGEPRPSITLPMWVARMFAPVSNVMGRRSGSPLWYTSDSLHALRFNPTVSGTKALDELGHSPRSVDETVDDMYRWASESR